MLLMLCVCVWSGLLSASINLRRNAAACKRYNVADLARLVTHGMSAYTLVVCTVQYAVINCVSH